MAAPAEERSIGAEKWLAPSGPCSGRIFSDFERLCLLRVFQGWRILDFRRTLRLHGWAEKSTTDECRSRRPSFVGVKVAPCAESLCPKVRLKGSAQGRLTLRRRSVFGSFGPSNLLDQDLQLDRRETDCETLRVGLRRLAEDPITCIHQFVQEFTLRRCSRSIHP